MPNTKTPRTSKLNSWAQEGRYTPPKMPSEKFDHPPNQFYPAKPVNEAYKDAVLESTYRRTPGGVSRYSNGRFSRTNGNKR